MSLKLAGRWRGLRVFCVRVKSDEHRVDSSVSGEAEVKWEVKSGLSGRNGCAVHCMDMIAPY